MLNQRGNCPETSILTRYLLKLSRYICSASLLLIPKPLYAIKTAAADQAPMAPLPTMVNAATAPIAMLCRVENILLPATAPTLYSHAATSLPPTRTYSTESHEAQNAP